MIFEWDSKKASSNLKKHSVSFNEAATVFADPLSEAFDDPEHSDNENRLLIIGHSNTNRLLFVSFVDKGRDTIRIISARVVTASERKQYEEIE